MNFSPLLDLLPPSFQHKKYLLAIIYTILALLLTLYFFFYRRRRNTAIQNNPRPSPVSLAPKEDIKPKLSLNGRALLLDPSAEVINTLEELSREFRLYPICQVLSDSEEQRIKEAYQSIKGIPHHRWIFCETDMGYRSILRQLNPRLHLEKDLYIAKQMAPYIPTIVMITEDQCEGFFQIPVFIHSHNFLIKLAKDSLN